MTEFKRHLREYAEHELKLIGFMESDFCPKFTSTYCWAKIDNLHSRLRSTLSSQLVKTKIRTILTLDLV